MVFENGKEYILNDLGELEEGIDACLQCALTKLCDNMADEMNLIEFMLCAEEEDFNNYENPVYVEKADIR